MNRRKFLTDAVIAGLAGAGALPLLSERPARMTGCYITNHGVLDVKPAMTYEEFTAVIEQHEPAILEMHRTLFDAGADPDTLHFSTHDNGKSYFWLTDDRTNQ